MTLYNNLSLRRLARTAMKIWRLFLCLCVLAFYSNNPDLRFFLADILLRERKPDDYVTKIGLSFYLDLLTIFRL